MKKWFSILLASTLVFSSVAFVSAKPVLNKQEERGKGEKEKKKQKASGTITSIDAAANKITLSVGDKSIELVIDTKTKIKIQEVKKPTTADIFTGDQAKIEYVSEESKNTATTIDIKRKKEQVKGTIEAIDQENHSVTVNGKAIVITEKTDIRMQDKKISFADILLQDNVIVLGFKKEDSIVALKIIVKREKIKLEGKVESVDAGNNTITLAGKVVKVTEETKVEIEDESILFGGLKAGTEVEAVVILKGEEYLALTIHIKDQKEDEDEDGEVDKGVIEGTVEAVDTTAKTITANGTVIEITDETKISSETGAALTLEDVKVGVKLKAEGTWKEKVLVATIVTATLSPVVSEQ